ncbi:MAG: hypothetical protein OSB21_07285, partial [Myxococcota bacterium]|nr:hypothetical protein [Myxococcota bacterium]
AQFVPALATRVQQLGRPAMVAAVATLQELNYKDVRECQIAVNLQRLLVPARTRAQLSRRDQRRER